MNKVVRFAACLQFGFWALLAGAAGYPPIYVDPQRGNDEENDGSEQAPFKTLDKGLETINAKRHLALYLAPGTYVLNDNVTFGLDTTEGESYNSQLVGLTGNPDDVIIDGQGKYWWHQSGQTRGICSVTFSNLYASATQALLLDKDQAVAYDDETQRVFSNCVVTCCQAVNKELICILGRTAMCGCAVRKCTASGKRIVAAKGGCQINDCVFSDNADCSAVIELSDYQSESQTVAGRERLAKSHLRGVDFLRNEATMVVHMVPDVESCRFLTNAVTGSVCVYPQNFSFGAPLHIGNSYFDANDSSGLGGCVCIDTQNSTITNSLIENCVFANGKAPNATGSYNCHGGAIRIQPKYLYGDGLTVRNVRISGMSNGTSQGSAVGVLFDSTLAGPGNVTFENCTLADNATTQSAVFFSKKSVGRVFFKNCVFSNGMGDADPPLHGIRGSESGGKMSDADLANMSNCLFASAIDYYSFAPEQENLNGFDPQFEAGSYVPSAKSPLVDAGCNNTAWMTTAYDLQRKPDGTLIGKPFRKRIVNDIVDIGAYEYRADPGLMLMLR